MTPLQLVDLIRSIAWAVTHPRQALHRGAVILGGCAVGCLAMVAVFVLAIPIGSFLALQEAQSRSFGTGVLVVAALVGAIAIGVYLRRLPERWRWRDEPAATGSAEPAATGSVESAAGQGRPRRSGRKSRPSLAELDARLARRPPRADDE